MTNPRKQATGPTAFHRLLVSAALAACIPLTAHAAGADATAQQRYKTETAACATKTNAEDRKTCMKEAGAAKEEAARNGLAKPDATYGANARARCDALPGDQKTACLARMSGAGTTSGSVEGGGVLRELTVRTPASAPATQAMGAASAAKP
ncbi:MAG: hypothetical protein ABIN96_00320 [Rubrivivax sp.]